MQRNKQVRRGLLLPQTRSLADPRQLLQNALLFSAFGRTPFSESEKDGWRN